jgi:hypothetical protein
MQPAPPTEQDTLSPPRDTIPPPPLKGDCLEDIEAYQPTYPLSLARARTLARGAHVCSCCVDLFFIIVIDLRGLVYLAPEEEALAKCFVGT